MFNPAEYDTFRFTERSLEPDGTVRLHYALGEHEFVEELKLPVSREIDEARVAPLLDLLHWVAGVSYYKTAAPPEVALETGLPGPATAAYLEALYSEGLGEFAVVNQLPRLPRPRFAHGPEHPARERKAPTRVLVPVGGGKDSIVALEIVRRSGLDFSLFTVRQQPVMRRTAEVAQVASLNVERTLPTAQLKQLHEAGALNGHIPITAIIACIALLTAELNGFDAIALANERSASRGNVDYDGIEVNHQFSKSARAEELLRGAAAEATDVDVFSILRPASELAIARRFATLEPYHHTFTSCNRLFHLDPAQRQSTWCGQCDKCRFVFLVLAPFMDPDALAGIFGKAMLDDEAQYEGFALLTATGGHKPFECVGEEEESAAAIAMLAQDPRWREKPLVKRLAEVVPPASPDAAFALSDEHNVPAELIDDVRAFLGA